MRITSKQAASLAARGLGAKKHPLDGAVVAAPRPVSNVTPPRPVGWDGRVLAVWVPIRPENPKRGIHSHWSKRRRWVQLRREATALYVWQALQGRTVPWPAGEPKLVTFGVYTPGGFDEGDNLPLVCSAIRDGLQDCAVIHSDARTSGHVFRYHQVITRAHRGFLITVQLTESVSL